MNNDAKYVVISASIENIGQFLYWLHVSYSSHNSQATGNALKNHILKPRLVCKLPKNWQQ